MKIVIGVPLLIVFVESFVIYDDSKRIDSLTDNILLLEHAKHYASPEQDP